MEWGAGIVAYFRAFISRAGISHRIKGTASKLSRSYQEWTEYPHPPLIEWSERSRLLRLAASYVFTRRQCAQMSPFTERRFTPISDLSLHLNLVQISSSPNFELLTLILATPYYPKVSCLHLKCLLAYLGRPTIMFRRLESSLPADPHFPADLEKLGYDYSAT
jgi:hypothetical protein